MKKTLSLLLALLIAVSAFSGTVLFVSAASSIDSYVNVVGGTLSFVTSEDYPWTQGSISIGKYGGCSGNAGKPGTSSFLRTTATFAEGQGISFDWRVSSQSKWDYVAFFADGVEVIRISGQVGPQTRVYPMTAGEHTLEWRYVKDEAYNSFEDRAYLDEVAIVLAEPTADISPVLNSRSSDFVFENTFGMPWTSHEYSSGVFVGKSGNAGCPDTESAVTMRAALTAGQVLCFNWGTNSEPGCDKLVFESNGVQIAEISGDTAMHEYKYLIPETGNYVFRWAYIKDALTDYGADCGYLYKVRVADDVPVEGILIVKKTSVAVGSSLKLTTTLRPASTTHTAVTWSSSSPVVATVDENGVVTGNSAGTAIITATNEVGVSASCELTVTAYTSETSYYVDGNRGNDNNKGTSSASACRTLEGVMEKINKAKGTVKLYVSGNIFVNHTIRIYDETINIVANGEGAGINRGTGMQDAIFNVGLNGTLMLGNTDGIGNTLRINGWSNMGSGGPLVVVDGGECQLLNGCEIFNNICLGSGAGVFLNSGTFMMTGGMVSSCTSHRYGGGIYAEEGDLRIYGGIIDGNTATYYGGGIYATENVTADIETSVVNGNTASAYNEICIGGPEAPVVSGIEDGASYDISDYPDGVRITWQSDFAVTAKLDGEDYKSGTWISALGSHEFTISDGYNPAVTFRFELIAPPLPAVTPIKDGGVYALADYPDGLKITWKSTPGVTATLNGESYVCGMPISLTGVYVFRLTDGEHEKVINFRITAPKPTFAYVYVSYSAEKSEGWQLINLGDAGVSGSAVAAEKPVAAAENVNGFIYGYTEEGEFFRSERDDGDVYSDENTVYGASLDGYTALDVTFYYKTAVLYALLSDNENNRFIAKASLADGTLTDIVPVNGETLMTLACDTDGSFWGISAGDEAQVCFVTIGAEAAEATAQFPTGTAAYYLQTSTFGALPGVMYWAQCDKDGGAIYEVHIGLKALRKLGEYGEDTEITAMFIEDLKPDIYTEHTDSTGAFNYRLLPDGGVEIIGYNWKNASGESLFASYESEGGTLYTVDIPETLDGCKVRGIARNAFRSDNVESPMSIGTVIIPASVETVGYGAFRGCAQLENVTIADGVENVGEYAFYQCPKLKETVLPASIEAIGYGAFAECAALAKVTVNGGETAFADYVFYNTADGLELHGYWPSVAYDYANAQGITFVDLVPYTAPVITGVEEGGKYYLSEKPEGVHPIWESDYTCTALLNGEMFEAGTAITVAGKYTLTVTDGRSEVSVSFTVGETPYKRGDFDGDGDITVTDALSALRIAAKLAEETDEAILIGDIDGDGHVSVTDALAILRVAAKLVESL